LRLTHPSIDYAFDFTNQHVYEFCIENRKLFQDIALDLVRQNDGGDGGFCLFDTSKEWTFSTSTFVVSDLLRLDVNNRRILTKLYDELKQNVDSAHMNELGRIRDDIFALFEGIVEVEKEALIFDDGVSAVDLMKLVNLRFNNLEASIVESITEFTRCAFEYLRVKLFCVINLRSYLTEEEYNEFAKYCIYNEYNVLLVESSSIAKKTHHKRVVIDEDFCELY
jgi:CRISPR-associated protein Csn2